MDIKNLKQGMIIKNYRVLCQILGIEPSDGNGKKAHMSELDRYAIYHNEGHKFIIDELYVIPKDKIDGRASGNNVSEYKLPLEKQVLIMLSQTHQQQVCLSKYLLCERLKLINPKYREHNYQYEELAIMLGMENFNVKDFYESTNSNLTYTIASTLNNLEKAKLISYQKVILGKSMLDGSCYEITDRDELKKVLTIENASLHMLNCENLGEIIYKGLHDTYTSIVNDSLREDLQIAYIFNAYKITSTNDILNKALNGDRYRCVNESLVNEQYLEKIVFNTKKRHDKANTVFGADINLKSEYRRSDKYIRDGEVLANKTIKIKDE